jgi:hypothetical protein
LSRQKGDPRLVDTIEQRLRIFEKWKDPAGCRATTEMWEKLNRTDSDSLYMAAVIRSVTAAVVRAADSSDAGKKEADAEAGRAVAWLKQAVTAGYKDVANLKESKDLDPLRDREDFKRLLAEVEGGAEKGKK